MKFTERFSGKNILKFLGLLWKTLRRFIGEEAMNHSAALAYYTAFALPAILIILISLVGYFWGEKEIEGQVFSEFHTFNGERWGRTGKIHAGQSSLRLQSHHYHCRD